MKSKLYLLLLFSALFLSGCSDAEEMTSEFQKTRDFFNNRLGVENKETVANDGSEAYYTWEVRPTNGQFLAPDKTSLLEATVLNIVDGDTFDARITNGKEERIRLILVNTPESKGKYEKNPQPFSIEAYEFTKKLLTDRKVWLEIGTQERDKYGRLLAYVWLDQVVYNKEVETKEGEIEILGKKIGKATLNDLLIREGLAHVAVYPPNTKYVDEFEELQTVAKKEKKGMW